MVGEWIVVDGRSTIRHPPSSEVMPFELHIALRYLLARRKQAFISVISLISTAGVAVGVMALVIALALTTGLQGEMRDRVRSILQRLGYIVKG